MRSIDKGSGKIDYGIIVAYRLAEFSKSIPVCLVDPLGSYNIFDHNER